MNNLKKSMRRDLRDIEPKWITLGQAVMLILLVVAVAP